MKAKYLVCPGFITSKYDRQTHWISADDLIRLYDVHPSECIVLRPHNERWALSLGLVELHPRYHREDYKLPTAKSPD